MARLIPVNFRRSVPTTPSRDTDRLQERWPIYSDMLAWGFVYMMALSIVGLTIFDLVLKHQ